VYFFYWFQFRLLAKLKSKVRYTPKLQNINCCHYLGKLSSTQMSEFEANYPD